MQATKSGRETFKNCDGGRKEDIMVENNELVRRAPNPEVIDNRMAKLTITYGGQQGDLPELVAYDSTDADLKQVATESVRDGHIPGIDAAPGVDFKDFVVDRFPARQDVPFNRLSLRPKTPFGSEEGISAIVYLQKVIGID